ncbi:MAG: amidase [Halieaceae bacterium]|jgi:amidase|nr:amidase [Halieaceae bacterium]
MADELWRKSAHQLAAMIRDKQVSSREVVTSHLERIDAVNPRVNAVTVTLAESALAAADKADAGQATGPFHGVPFTIKENIDCAGSATTNGLPVFADAIPAADAPVVARMKAAGAIPLARTNLPEMGLRITTDNPLRGRTNNPWDITRTAGGSSGGEGAALATGMSPIGLGNDIGGSLRNPAYCCGITSLKPTTGRIPFVQSIPGAAQPNSFRLMCVEGAMARSVADLNIAYRVLSGWHPQDPHSVPAALEGPAVDRTVALVTRMPDSTLPAATIAAIHRAGELLEAEGWRVEEVTPPELARVNEIWAQVLGSDIRNLLPLLTPIMSDGAVDMLKQFLDEFDPAAMSATQLYCERDRLAVAWSAFFQRYPLVIGPTWADLPFLHDADIDPETGVETFQRRLQFITPGNLLGLPAVALPMAVVDGLPTGVQIYADRWREDLCLDAAGLIEARVGHITPIDPTF